jgi:hypothetical protein
VWTVTDTDFAALGEEGVCAVFASLVESVAVGNLYLMRRGKYPPLFGSGVKWQQEPNAGRFEEIASCRRVLARGWGDCDDLCAWLIAEYRLAGEQAKARVYVKFYNGTTLLDFDEFLAARAAGVGRLKSLYHVQVRRADQTIEDPSRLLGM